MESAHRTIRSGKGYLTTLPNLQFLPCRAHGSLSTRRTCDRSHSGGVDSEATQTGGASKLVTGGTRVRLSLALPLPDHDVSALPDHDVSAGRAAVVISVTLSRGRGIAGQTSRSPVPECEAEFPDHVLRSIVDRTDSSLDPLTQLLSGPILRSLSRLPGGRRSERCTHDPCFRRHQAWDTNPSRERGA